MVKVKNLYGNSQKQLLFHWKIMNGLFFVSLQKVHMARLILTGDGSHTLFIPELNEHYHSTYGALTESLHVFIRSGLDCFEGRSEITVFEAGFGTGLNALLTALGAIHRGMKIRYFALEKYPVDIPLVMQLNYPHLLKESEKDAERIFSSIHEATWDKMIEIDPCFYLKKLEGDLCCFVPDDRYDLIYFDAFAPEKQPEMWTIGDYGTPCVSHESGRDIYYILCKRISETDVESLRPHSGKASRSAGEEGDFKRKKVTSDK